MMNVGGIFHSLYRSIKAVRIYWAPCNLSSGVAHLFVAVLQRGNETRVEDERGELKEVKKSG